MKKIYIYIIILNLIILNYNKTYAFRIRYFEVEALYHNHSSFNKYIKMKKGELFDPLTTKYNYQNLYLFSIDSTYNTKYNNNNNIKIKYDIKSEIWTIIIPPKKLNVKIKLFYICETPKFKNPNEKQEIKPLPFKKENDVGNNLDSAVIINHINIQENEQNNTERIVDIEILDTLHTYLCYKKIKRILFNYFNDNYIDKNTNLDINTFYCDIQENIDCDSINREISIFPLGKEFNSKPEYIIRDFKILTQKNSNLKISFICKENIE